MDAEDERADLLKALFNLVYLIDQTKDPAQAAAYADQLNKLKAKIITLRPAKKSPGQS
jgi:hypothetical protein